MAGASLLALLDDIATVLDDVAVLTKVAAKKTTGVLGDDLALNAQQVAGVRAERELPVVWAVAKGSLLNKANPTIIEDNCFIGARSEIVEGVIVEENSVISMGVYIGQSTRIYDRATGEVSYGRIPAGSVVVAGNLPSADGKYSLYCAVIVKRVDAQTRAKTSLNDLLRD
jgi:hypothetical protein